MEDDGWILVLVNDADVQRTRLVILDAQAIQGGELEATLKLATCKSIFGWCVAFIFPVLHIQESRTSSAEPRHCPMHRTNLHAEFASPHPAGAPRLLDNRLLGPSGTHQDAAALAAIY